MKVPRKAWQTGAVWRTTNERGTLEAIIMGPSERGKSNYKYVHMVYLNGYASDKPVQQDYSHSHMLRHFEYTGETAELPIRIDYFKELKF